MQDIVEEQGEALEELQPLEKNLCLCCTADSDYGVIGVNKEGVYHNHYCTTCYYSIKQGRQITPIAKEEDG
jgi:hypothetical protein